MYEKQINFIENYKIFFCSIQDSIFQLLLLRDLKVLSVFFWTKLPSLELIKEIFGEIYSRSLDTVH